MAPKTHSDVKTNARDAIVAFGAEHGALPIPVERRVARYLRQERLYAVGGDDDTDKKVRSCYSLDVEAGAWVAEAPMLEGRSEHCLAVVHGELWAVGGRGNNDRDSIHSVWHLDPTTNTFWTNSLEHLDPTTNTWVQGPNMLSDRISFGVAILNGELWAVGGSRSLSFALVRAPGRRQWRVGSWARHERFAPLTFRCCVPWGAVGCWWR